MSEPTSVPVTTEKTVVVTSLSRLWTLTILSLSLNALILVLLIVGAVMHHHHPRRPDFCGHGHDRFMGGPRGERGGDRGFHSFGGDWNPAQNQSGDRQDGFGPGRDRRGSDGHGPMGGGFGGERKGPPDPAKMTDMVLDGLTQKLTLTDDEKAKIKPIIDAQVADIQKDMEAQRAARQKAMEDTRARIRPLLTADQQKQLDALPLPGQKPSGPEAPPTPAK